MTAAVGRWSRCARCGYDLRHGEGTCCPECGLAFDRDAPPPPEVPWLLHREIGAWTAYWQTVELVVLRPREFARQARWTGRADARHSESFRQVTIAVAAVSVMLTVGCVDFHLYGTGLSAAAATRHVAGTMITALLASTAFLLIATLRSPVDLYGPHAWDIVLRFRHLQKFTCAAMAFSPAVALFAVAAIAAAKLGFVPGGFLFAAVAGLLAVAVILVWVVDGARYIVHVGRPGVAQALEALTWRCLLLLGATVTAGAAAMVLRDTLRPWL